MMTTHDDYNMVGRHDGCLRSDGDGGNGCDGGDNQ